MLYVLCSMFDILVSCSNLYAPRSLLHALRASPSLLVGSSQAPLTTQN